MPLFGFKRRFVEPIRQGTKTHTIRGHRKVDCKPGDTMYLYCGLRQPGAFRIIEPPTCTKVEPIALYVNDQARAQVEVEGILLAEDERIQLAIRDGFASWEEMAGFWNGLYPFDGTINHWRPPCKP